MRSYKINDNELEKLTLGETINKAANKKLISNGVLDNARRVNKIRNKYIHVDINKIKKMFKYNIYYNTPDWIQMIETEKEAEPDCLEAYKNLMEMLQHLYTEERYPL